MLILSNKLKIGKFQDTIRYCLITPILGYSSGGSPLVSQFCKNLGLNCLFLIKLVPVFLWTTLIYWVGNFGQWAG